MLFLKPPTSVSGPTDSILRPPETSALDYEVEPGVVIGTAGYRIARQDALKHVAGYTLANDVTARDIAFGSVSSPGLGSMTSLVEDEIVA